MTFGEKLQKLRKTKGMSQEELAEHLGVSRQAVSRWELETVTPDVANVVGLSKLFNVSTDYLLNTEFNKTDDTLENIQDKENKEEFSKNKIRILSGVIISILGTIGVLVLSILGSVKKEFVVEYNFDESIRKVHQGIDGFLFVNKLYWLMALSIVAVLVGMVLIFLPKIKSHLQKSKSSDKE